MYKFILAFVIVVASFLFLLYVDSSEVVSVSAYEFGALAQTAGAEASANPYQGCFLLKSRSKEWLKGWMASKIESNAEPEPTIQLTESKQNER